MSTVGEINLKQLKAVVNAVLDHLIEDLKIETVPIEENKDFYWHCEAPGVYEMSKDPAGLSVGRLTDDVYFIRLVRRGETADASINLVHVAPLLRYIADTVGA
jgi:hypothetical protein